ncbi:DUF4237 domain-containing protein [Flavobacterium bomense]|uniref:DUF4237 domain-containing protein n=1 Tax=Flavobacterium bomense TaxID=2497483 RepID=A0A3S0MDG8_9FLAO|nr:FG-GAP-like repeat-containing protein [Flavobacterium bomense]RTZ03569.1 DUF4237 domain-containing protein [Flavobacterium bomense]
MKKFYFTLILLGYSIFISAQDMGGTPVQGLIPIKRTSTTPEKESNTTSRNNETSKLLNTTSAPTGNSAELGITEGQLSVSLTGGATYNIPIAVPAGINGVVPQIGLTYNSQGGNGMAGYGWNISGVSAITRIPATKFHDETIDGVDFNSLDRFAFDGQRLLVKNGTAGVYGANGTVYETEGFSNVKITSYGVHPSGTNFGPAYFIVQYPDGSKAYYGNSTDSRSITDWAITYWENPQGIRISYHYTLANNNLTIASVNYGALLSATAINQIQFVYKARQRTEQAYIGGQSFLKNTILSEIKVVGNGIGFRNYTLGYDATSLGYERLTSIIEKSGDNSKTFNPTVFSYENTSESIKYSPITTDLTVGNISSQNASTVSGDFDGDGNMDFLIYPTTGSDSKAKYWLFNGLSPESGINIGWEHPVGKFDDIFPVSWLSWNNKLMPMQGWTVLKGLSTGTTTFSTYSTGTTGSIYFQYEKSYQFPKFTLDYYYTCDYGGGYQQPGIQEDYTNQKAIEPDPSGPTHVYSQTDIPKHYVNGDFNGDGLTDVVVIEKEITYSYQSGCSGYTVTRPGGSSYFVNLDRRLTDNFVNGAGYITSNSSSKFMVADFNGDGKSDIYVFDTGKVKVYSLNDAKQFVLLYQTTTTDTDIALDKPILMGDYNGDGKTDFIIPKGGNNYAKYMSTGSSFIKTSVTYNIPYRTNYITSDFVEINNLIANDIDGDGKTDLISYSTSGRYSTNSAGYVIGIWKNMDSNFVNSVTKNTGQITGAKPYSMPIFLTSERPNFNLELAAISDNKIYHFKSTKDFNKEHLLNTITTGKGVTETITYQPLDPKSREDYNSIYTNNGSIELFPNTDILIAPSFQVVTKLEKQSTTVYKKQLFSYHGAVSNLEGLGFLGFRATMRTNWHDNSSPLISSVSKFDVGLRGANTENYSVLGFASPSYTPTTNFISKSVLTYESELSDNKVFKLKNTIVQQENGLDNTNSETTTSYDSYNSPIAATTYLKEGNTVVQTTINDVSYDDQPAGSTYYIGRPTSKISNVSVLGDATSSEELYTYSNHLLTQIKKKGHNTDYIIEDNGYDAFGNITKKTITAPALTPRITNYEYDTSGRFLIKSTDIEGLSTTFTYNTSNGLLNSETNPYGSVTSYFYDSWFKKIKTTDYLGKNNVYEYMISSEKNTVATRGDDGSYSLEVFDDLGRKIKSQVKDINGNPVSVSYLYDIYDRNTQVSEPYFGEEPSQWNTTQYDIYGRLIQSNAFTGKTTTVAYSGLTTTVNDGTITKSSTKNAIGNVVTMTETPGGTINYTYFANGNLKTTDYAGVVTTLEQDGWGRKTKLTDPSAGTYLYAYNSLGEATKETTPNGSTTYTLDNLGKLTQKIINGTNTNTKTTYTYDATTKLLTASILEDLAEGTITNNAVLYDSYKRLYKTTETTPYATFTKQITFDAFGRIDKETSTAFASGKTSAKTIKNTYKNGYPWQILDDTTQQVLWQINTTTARGQLGTAIMGNSIAITNTYDTFGFTTQSKQDTTGNNPLNIMTLNTVFDSQKGNLTSRTNSMFNTNDDFTYDSLDRLTSYPNALGVQESQTYEDSGKIKQNSLGTYNYTTSAKPYQNTSITLTPEANGYYANREGIYSDSMETQQGWAISSEPNVMTYDNSKANTGNYSLKINNTATTEKVVHSDKWITIDNTVATEYTYSAWIFSNSPQAELFLFMKTVNETGYYTQVDNVVENTINQWKYVQKTVLVPANIKKLNIRLDNNAQGIVWFDDVQIRKTTNPATLKRELNVSYNTFKSPVQIEETGVDKISFTYNDDNSRSTMFYGGMQEDKLQRQYRKHYSADGSMEIKQNMTTGVLEFVTYIGGDGYTAPIVLKSDGTTQNYLYLHRDYQGSILAITNAIGQVLEKRLFDAWGTIAKVQDGAGNTLNGLTILDRGYTGHEHLQSVGLIHMNGRLYDLKLHRFLQPDNYVQDPSNTQNFNRYGYCINNPLKYTDINGEWFGIDDAIAGVIGGLVNLGVNIWQGNIHNIGQGFAAFGAGAAAGVLSLYGPAGWAAGGAIVGGTNAWLSGTDPVKGALMGGVTGLVGGQLGQWASGAIGNVVVNGIKVTSPILQGTIIGSLSSGATGGVMSFSMSLIGGANLNDAFNAAGQGFSMGLVTGGIAGASAAYANSVKNGVNAFNGKKLDYPSNNGAIKGTEQTITLDKNQVITRFGPESGSYASPEGTSFTQRSLSPEYNVKEIQLNSYKVIKPIPNVESSTIKPYYFQKGMGTQYKLPYNIDYLRTKSYIIKQ